LLHDGTVEQLTRSGPDELTLSVEIGYLRTRFSPPGDAFMLRLGSCTHFSYSEYGHEPLTDLEAIAEKRTEILNLEAENPVIVSCVMGSLRLEYLTLELSLDSGEPIPVTELAAAADAYWSEWSALHAPKD